jgi:hypothetical protein
LSSISGESERRVHKVIVSATARNKRMAQVAHRAVYRPSDASKGLGDAIGLVL